MDFDKYQKLASKTAVYPNIGNNFIYPTLGLVGEAGEIAEKIKKIIRDDEGKITIRKKREIIKELGDVLWYIAQLSTELQIPLSKIAKTNIGKLSSRKRRKKIHGEGDNR
jgi:NTP pyrophosphatase (non-canonical NTP hydrolase)